MQLIFADGLTQPGQRSLVERRGIGIRSLQLRDGALVLKRERVLVFQQTNCMARRRQVQINSATKPASARRARKLRNSRADSVRATVSRMPDMHVTAKEAIPLKFDAVTQSSRAALNNPRRDVTRIWLSQKSR